MARTEQPCTEGALLNRSWRHTRHGERGLRIEGRYREIGVFLEAPSSWGKVRRLVDDHAVCDRLKSQVRPPRHPSPAERTRSVHRTLTAWIRNEYLLTMAERLGEDGSKAARSRRRRLLMDDQGHDQGCRHGHKRHDRIDGGLQRRERSDEAHVVPRNLGVSRHGAPTVLTTSENDAWHTHHSGGCWGE